jgi:hypothetical protein
VAGADEVARVLAAASLIGVPAALEQATAAVNATTANLQNDPFLNQLRENLTALYNSINR